MAPGGTGWHQVALGEGLQIDMMSVVYIKGG